MTTDLESSQRGLHALSGGEGAHPPLPRPRYPWKTRIGIPLLVAGALVALLVYAARDSLRPTIDVQVVPVVLKAGSETAPTGAVVQAAGWVEADPYPIAVSALTDGIVKEVLVLEGQPVKAEQVVARLVDDDARLALAKAEAELLQQLAELRAAQRQWENPVDRDRAVAAGEAMAAETKAELQRLDAEVGAEQARADELADQVKRLEEGFRAKAASELEYVGAKLKLAAQRATLQAMKARKPVLEAKLRQREAELTAARQNRALRIDEEKGLEAAKAAVGLASAVVDEAKLRLARTEVRSPADGVVLSRHITPGSKLMFNSDSEISSFAIHLFDPARLQVRVDVPLADAAKVGVGMEAKVIVGVLPDKAFDGVVTRRVQEADVAKNTIQVKVAIKDPSPDLKPEMLARVRFIARAPATSATVTAAGQLLFVPEPLVHGNGSVLIVDRTGNFARRRQVELGGVRRDGWVSVVSGVSPGDLLIARPAGVVEGARVRIVGEADLSKGSEHALH